MNETKKLMKSTVAYLFGNMLSKVIVFFMLPLYTAYIPPDNYGYYDLTITYISFFATILFLNIWWGTMRFMFDSSDPKDKLKTVYSSAPIYMASLILYVILFSSLNVVFKIQFFPLVLLYGVCLTLQNIYGNIARGFGKSTLFVFSGIIATLVTVLLNIILIVGFKFSYWSLYVASSAGILVQVILLEISLKLIPNFSKSLIEHTLVMQLLRFSLPLCLNSVAYWFLTSFNRVVIVNMLGESQNGYFAIASKFAVIVSLVGSCFSMAWQETAFKKEGENRGSGAYYTKAGNLYVRFLFMGTICLLPVIGVAFKYLVNPLYNSARTIIPLSLLGTAVSLYSAFTGDIFTALKRNKVIFTSTITASIVNIAVIYLLITRIGLQAANISFLIGFTVNCIMRDIMLHKSIGFHLSLKPFILYIPLFAAVTYVFETQGFYANAAALLAAGIITLLLFKDFIKSIWYGIKQGKVCEECSLVNEITLEELKKIELNILHDFEAFCEEHHLRYYLAYGTLIGAVKYHGFIPWDDDIDVFMPRPDYEKLLEITEGKITEYVDVLTYQNTPGYIYPFAKAVNNKTLMIEEDHGKLHPIGAFIDIFPIDGLPEDTKQINKLCTKRKYYKKLLGWSIYPIKDGKTPRYIIFRVIVYPVCRTIGYRFFAEKMDKLAQKHNYEEALQVAQVVWDKPVIAVSRKDYLETVQLDFEGGKFTAPSNYDDHLKMVYGNYREDPPEDKCISHHHFKAYWK